MRKTALVNGLLFILVGCDRLPSIVGQKSTVSLLKDGASAACSQDDVKKTLFSQVKPADKDLAIFFKADDIPTIQAAMGYDLDTISVASVNKTISSVTCEANLTVRVRNNPGKTFSIQYELRPSVDDPTSFIMHSALQDASEYASHMAIQFVGDPLVEARQQAITNEQAPAPPVQTENATDQVIPEEQPSGEAGSPPSAPADAQTNNSI